MKPIPASLISVLAGWALMLIGVVVGQLVTFGSVSDFGSLSFWVGIFALAGWAVVVLPVVARFGRSSFIASLRWSWAVWSGLGVVAFGVLVIPIMGRDGLLILWYPAILGCIAGCVFALLTRMRDKKPA